MNARAIWYHEYAQIKRLCTDIAGNRDWCTAVRLPCTGEGHFDSSTSYGWCVYIGAREIRAARPPPPDVARSRSRPGFFPAQDTLERENRSAGNLPKTQKANPHRQVHGAQPFRETSNSLQKEAVTIGLLSQNVRGFGSTVQDRADWLASSIYRHSNDHFDVVLLQETHIDGDAK